MGCAGSAIDVRCLSLLLGDVRRWGIVLGVWTVVGTFALIHYASAGGELDAFSGGFGAGFIVVTTLLAWWWSHVGAKVLNRRPGTQSAGAT